MGVPWEIGERLTFVFNCRVDSVAFSYLKVTFHVNLRTTSTWELVIGKFREKLARWQRKLLSFGGRVTLINSALSSLPF